jgi:hypothetical protein
MSDDNGVMDHATIELAVLHELRAVRRMLEANTRTEVLASYAIGNARRRTQEIPDFPVAGGRRVVLGTPGFGATVTLAATVGQLLVPAQETRHGGQLVNSGANPVTVYLCTVGELTSGLLNVPQFVLEAAGGAWDFTISGLVWVGDVCGLSTSGSTVTVATV